MLAKQQGIEVVLPPQARLRVPGKPRFVYTRVLYAYDRGVPPAPGGGRGYDGACGLEPRGESGVERCFRVGVWRPELRGGRSSHSGDGRLAPLGNCFSLLSGA